MPGEAWAALGAMATALVWFAKAAYEASRRRSRDSGRPPPDALCSPDVVQNVREVHSVVTRQDRDGRYRVLNREEVEEAILSTARHAERQTELLERLVESTSRGRMPSSAGAE